MHVALPDRQGRIYRQKSHPLESKPTSQGQQKASCIEGLVKAQIINGLNRIILDNKYCAMIRSQAQHKVCQLLVSPLLQRVNLQPRLDMDISNGAVRPRVVIFV